MYNEEQKILFRYSQELDVSYLQELYGEDLQQAEMVFESSAQQLKSELSLAEARFHDGDIPGLKKIVHKMKPLFGYIGLNKIMSEFAAFEQECAQVIEPASVESGFQRIRMITEEALQKVDTETKRLKQYNTQYL
ncbi:MAG: hypothetical protein JST63_05415 [Bacteroidetes bacterium]|nr:hypothetical protein [Bacteroidota bacterium]